MNEDKAIIETLTSIKRAGADLIATYFAKQAVKLISLIRLYSILILLTIRQFTIHNHV